MRSAAKLSSSCPPVRWAGARSPSYVVAYQGAPRLQRPPALSTTCSAADAKAHGSPRASLVSSRSQELGARHARSEAQSRAAEKMQRSLHTHAQKKIKARQGQAPVTAAPPLLGGARARSLSTAQARTPRATAPRIGFSSIFGSAKLGRGRGGLGGVISRICCMPRSPDRSPPPVGWMERIVFT